MKIVILGDVCIDKNSSEKSFYTLAGSPAKFISLFLDKKSNAKTTIIASYGSDFLPFRENLNLYPLKPNVSKTLVYENTVVNGKRSQKCHFYNIVIPPEIDQDITRLIKNADVLFIAPLTPYFSSKYIKKITDLANKNCLKILLPQGYFRNFNKNNNVVFRKFKEADSILPLIDFVILSGEDYPNIEDLSFKWNKKHNTTFIITKEGKEAIIIYKKNKTIVPTKPIPFDKIVDSIGAGDTFSASFGYYYFKNKDLVKSVKLANQSAREKLLSKF